MSSTGWPNNLTFVDDLDSRMQYSAGWQVVTGGAEVEGTKHGADEAGMTATFKFTGTFISVVGSLGSVDVYGIPTTTYSLDGTLVDTYTAPVLVPGTFRLHQTFFNSPTIDPGTHTLVITNINSTSPNVVWLDYILFAESESPSSATTSSTTPSSATVSESVQSSSAPPIAGSRGSNTGAIVGGVVGGLGGVAVLAGLLLWWLVRRRRAHMSAAVAANEGAAPADIHPFEAWAPDTAHCPTLPPGSSSTFEGLSFSPRASPHTMTESSIGPGRVLSWPMSPDLAYQHDSGPAVNNSKDVMPLTAGLGTHEGGTDPSAPPPYVQ